MKFLGCIAALLLFFSGAPARAHSEQEAPATVEIWPQRTFLTVRVAGNGGDLADKISAQAHAATPAQLGDVSAAAHEKARDYFARHLMFKQGGARLHGKLKTLRLWQVEALDPSRTRFEAVFRFERDARVAQQPLRVTSGLFDYLQKTRTVVSLQGETRVLKANETAEFAATLATASLISNIARWNWDGIAHPFSGADHLIFIVALLLAAAHLPLRAVWWALGAFTLGHGVTFSLATLGVLALPLQLVSIGIAASILLMGGHDLLLARAADNAKPFAARRRSIFLAAFAGACGLVHGFAYAPPLVARGLPEQGLALCLLAFVIGTALTQSALCVATQQTLKVLRARFEHGAQYGGVTWTRATQFASLAIVAIGGYWMFERIVG